MWMFRFAILLALTGCLDGWEKNPTTEKGMPLAQKTKEMEYPAPSPAAFGLKIFRVNEDGQRDDILGLIQVLEGERLQIVAQGEVYDSRVELEDIVLMNPESLPQAQVSFDRARKELFLDWPIPERWVQAINENFQLSAPITIRMRARYRSVTPEGNVHLEARQIEASFQYIVYRDFFGLEPTILRVEPAKLEMVENEVLRFDLILDDPGSATANHGVQPEIRVVPVVPTTNTYVSDGAHFVRRDFTRPATVLDPSQPTVWKIPVLMDLRGREVTSDSNNFKFGLQAISKYRLNNNITCASTGECDFKEIASRVHEVETRVYTRLQPVRTSLTFAPVVYAGQRNFVQWQMFDPEDAADVSTDSIVCPAGAVCSCSRVGRNRYAQCMLEWNPPCGTTTPASLRLYARSSSRMGPPREAARRAFHQEIRISQSECNQQGGNP